MLMADALLLDTNYLLAHTAFGSFQWVDFDVLAVFRGAFDMSRQIAGAHPPFYLWIWYGRAELVAVHSQNSIAPFTLLNDFVTFAAVEGTAFFRHKITRITGFNSYTVHGYQSPFP
jgi:hypothetical protein